MSLDLLWPVSGTYVFFDEITKQLDLAMGHPSLRYIGDRLSSRECANKGRAISDHWTDNFAEASQFFDELSTLKRTRIDLIGHED